MMRRPSSGAAARRRTNGAASPRAAASVSMASGSLAVSPVQRARGTQVTAIDLVPAGPTGARSPRGPAGPHLDGVPAAQPLAWFDLAPPQPHRADRLARREQRG